MAQVARLVTTTALVGGVLAGSLALGAGLASAAPAPTGLVPAKCGQTVSALPGDTVRVKPQLGPSQDYNVGGSPGTTAHIQTAMGMCNVDVRMLAPAPVAYAPMYAAPAAVAPAAVAPGTQRIAPAAPVAPAPVAAAPLAAAPAVPAAPAPRAAASAPAKAAARSAQATAPAAVGSMAEAPLPPAALLGAPAPGTAPAPALAPPAADPASQVQATSNNSALPADTSGGLGVPILIALVAGTGVAAFGVRMFMLRRGSTPAHAAAGALPAEPDGSAFVDPAEEATVLHTDFGGVHRAA